MTKSTEIRYILLADDADALKVVSRWYYDEWAGKIPGISINTIKEKLSQYGNRDCAPLLVVADDDGEFVAAAELKIREMSIYPDREYWIGGVYVTESHRGRGLATRMVQEVIRRAKEIGIETLHLQSEQLDGGLYTRIGFTPIEQVEYGGHQVVVMEYILIPQRMNSIA